MDNELERKYPIGTEFNLTTYNGDGPYLVRVINNQRLEVKQGDHEYRYRYNDIQALQINFLGKIPRFYYHSGNEWLMPGADNYVTLRKDGFHFGIEGKGPKPPGDYYKESRKMDRERKQLKKEKEKDPRELRKEKRKLRRKNRYS
jgi:hypothetical protein